MLGSVVCVLLPRAPSSPGHCFVNLALHSIPFSLVILSRQVIDPTHVTSTDLNDDLEAMITTLPGGQDGLVSRDDFVRLVDS